MNPTSTWLEELAADLETATGWAAFPYPVPSISPPCVLLLPGADLHTGPQRTGCLLNARITIRLVTAVQEPVGAHRDLFDRMHQVLNVLQSFVSCEPSARQYGESRWWVLDIVHDATVPLDYPAPALAGAVPREGN